MRLIQFNVHLITTSTSDIFVLSYITRYSHLHKCEQLTTYVTANNISLIRISLFNRYQERRRTLRIYKPNITQLLERTSTRLLVFDARKLSMLCGSLLNFSGQSFSRMICHCCYASNSQSNTRSANAVLLRRLSLSGPSSSRGRRSAASARPHTEYRTIIVLRRRRSKSNAAVGSILCVALIYI